MALLTDLISYWTLDESSDGSGAVARVDSHSSNDLTDYNTTKSGTGIISNGADFEEDNSEYLSISGASETGLDLTGTQKVTISLWVKLESQPAVAAHFASKYTTTTAQRLWRFLYYNSGGTYQIRWQVGATGSSTVCTASYNKVLNNGTWYHLVVTYDDSANETEFFIDGESVATSAGCGYSIYDNSDTPFAIGAANVNTTPAYFTDGIIDEVGIWSRILTPTEVGLLYNGGAGLAYPFVAGTTAGRVSNLMTMGVS